MGSVKSLAKDTAIYGVSSILGRFLNWLLVPLYTNIFPTAEYGIVTYVYSVVALVLVILTCGMETGYFRFANDDRFVNSRIVYSTSLIWIGSLCAVFLALVFLFLQPVTAWMECGGHSSFVALMAVCVAVDAFTAVPFALLRQQHRALKFASLKIIGIAVNISLNLFFILACPLLAEHAPATVSWFYDPSFGIGYIFLANLISSLVMLPLLVPELTGFPWRFDRRLFAEMFRYAWPLLVLGFAGIMNQNLDKILLPHLISDPAVRMSVTGVYGACFKLGVVMVVFLQAFRFAYEPFIFDRSRDEGDDRRRSLAVVMKWFIAFAMMIFLAVMVYMPILQLLIGARYRSGIGIVPVIILGELFYGISSNLSVWYKKTDRTHWGMWLTLIGLAVVVSLNIILVPRIGYYGAAWASFACYATMMILSYLLGRKYYPVDYPLGRIFTYVALSLALWGVMILVSGENKWVNMGVGTLLIAVYLFAVLRIEHISLRSALPFRRDAAKRQSR